MELLNNAGFFRIYGDRPVDRHYSFAELSARGMVYIQEFLMEQVEA